MLDDVSAHEAEPSALQMMGAWLQARLSQTGLPDPTIRITVEGVRVVWDALAGEVYTDGGFDGRSKQ